MNTKITIKSRILISSLALILLLPQAGQCFYNTSTGKWLSRDPIEEKGGKNLYAFVDNNPADKIDAFGMEALTVPNWTQSGTSDSRNTGGANAVTRFDKLYIDVTGVLFSCNYCC